MKCKNCNVDLLPEFKYCGYCGFKIIKVNECPSCREENNPEFSFCVFCGESLPNQPEAEPNLSYLTENPTVPLRREFLADSNSNSTIKKTEIIQPTSEIKSNITGQQNILDGERKIVTVIFADICGFTTLSESHDAEEVMNIINSCFERLVSIIYKYEGYVDKYMGDCIMALFGVPIAHENDSQRAVQTALLMIEELNEFNKGADIPLGISIGINTGEAVADYMGSQMKRDYTVIGDTVNVAQRLQSKADRNQILISHSVYVSCKDNFEINLLAPIALKGKAEKVRCYEVKGFKKKRSSISITNQQISIGRKEEIKRINSMIDNVGNGSAQLLNIVGDGGVGKTHLKYYILDRCFIHDTKFHWFDVSCETYTKNVLLGIFISLFRDIGKIYAKNEDFKEKIDRISNQNKKNDGVHYIRETLKIWFNDSNIDSYDEETLKKIMFIYVKELINEIANDSPTLIIIEDVQWADSASLALIDYLLLETKTVSPIFFVITQRPDFSHEFLSKIKSERIEIKCFDKNESNEFIKNYLSCEVVPDDFIEPIYNKTQGNPLYIEEIIKSFIDKGYIIEEEGKWHFKKTQKIEIPSTIVETIQARIDNLATDKKRTLQHASVIGKEFKYEHLNKLYLHDGLRVMLSELDQSQIIQRLKRDIDGEFAFKHAIICEVVYGTILKKKVTAIHNEYAKILEEILAGNIYDYFEVLAHHYFLGESWTKAFKYLIESFNKHIKIYDHEGALLFLLNAIDISTKYLKNEKLLFLTNALIECYERLGRTDDALKLLNDSSKIDGTTEEKANFHCNKGRILRVKGQFRESLDEFDRSISYATDLLLRLDIAREKATTLQRMGEFQQSLEILNEGIVYFSQYPESRIEAKYLNNLGMLCINIGKHNDAFPLLKRSLEIREHLNDLWGVSVVLSNIILLLIDDQRSEEVWEYYSKYKELAQKIGDKVGMGYINHNMGCLHYFLNDYEKANNFLTDASLIANEVNDARLISSNNIFYGMNLYFLGNKDDGKDILTQNLKMATDIGCHEGMFWGNYFKGELDEKQSESNSAVEYFKNAEIIAMKMNNKQYIEKVRSKIDKRITEFTEGVRV